MQRLFGTDGIRARAGQFPLDEATVRRIGAAFTLRIREQIGRRPCFVSGRDTRESGGWIEQAIHEGVAAADGEIESTGVMTTPGIAFVTGHYGFDAGIVVSASHNPFEDNGIKFFMPDGRKLDEATEREIEADISRVENVAPLSFDVDAKRAGQFHIAYIEHLASFVPSLDLSGLKIAVDCANGAACGFAGKVLDRFGADLLVINNSPNGRNINKDCGSLHLEELQKAVLANEADLGVAYDGDADRALFVDEKGTVVDGDGTLWILARRFKDEGRLANSKVVATVMSNLGLELALNSRDIRLVRTSVGDKYVLDELLKTGASIGGEQSGHIIFPHESLVGDGMLTTLFLLDAMLAKDRKLSEAVAGFVRYPQVLINVRVKAKRPFESVPEIAEATADLESKLDGTGRLLLRYSGTENLARIMVEGRDQAEIDADARTLANIIETALGQV